MTTSALPAAGAATGAAAQPGRAAAALARLADAALWVLAAAGIVAVAGTALAAGLGMRPVVVRSGSMEPVIPTGALVLSRPAPAADAGPGAVVMVRDATGRPVVHRVVEASPGPAGTTRLLLKGDANEAPDQAPVVTRSAGRVVAVVPGLGRVVGMLGSPTAAAACGGGAVALAMAAARRRR